MLPHPLILKYKNIIKTKLNLIGFIQKIFYQKQSGIYNQNLLESKKLEEIDRNKSTDSK